jgi:DNA repair protein RAD50
MDKSVPLLMGVSNAILENVIFCHQEESLWPFSDQANLKKIFDEIFDTTKYTKALGEMRQVAKKYTKYAKEFKQELDLKRKDYEQYAKLKSSIGTYDAKLKEIRDQITTAQSKKDSLDTDLRDLERDLTRI